MKCIFPCVFELWFVIVAFVFTATFCVEFIRINQTRNHSRNFEHRIEIILQPLIDLDFELLRRSAMTDYRIESLYAIMKHWFRIRPSFWMAVQNWLLVKNSSTYESLVKIGYKCFYTLVCLSIFSPPLYANEGRRKLVILTKVRTKVIQRCQILERPWWHEYRIYHRMWAAPHSAKQRPIRLSNQLI